MTEALLIRLTLLKDSGVITEGVYVSSTAFVKEASSLGMLKDADASAMMVTHIAMALQRIHTGETVCGMDEDTRQEVCVHPNYHAAINAWQKTQHLLGGMPEYEKFYILANFCNNL